jgi:hypothetical protein
MMSARRILGPGAPFNEELRDGLARLRDHIEKLTYKSQRKRQQDHRHDPRER